MDVVAVEAPRLKTSSGGGKLGVCSVIHRRRANKGSLTLRTEVEEKLFTEMLTPTQSK